MMPLIAEQLTTQFYQWELLGRGWIRSNDPVCLEPPFTPFFGHFPWKEPEYVDDGIRHSLISGLLASFKKPKPKSVHQAFEISYSPFLFENDDLLRILQVHFQRGAQFSSSQTEQFFSMLSYCTDPVSFEIIGTFERIFIQIVCRESARLYIRGQLQTFFPAIAITETGSDINTFQDNQYYVTVDFGLEQEFTRPINTHHNLDSLSGLFSILEHLEEGQKVIFQVLCSGLVNKWENSILRSVSDGDKGSFFADAPDMLPLAKQKVSKPLLAVCVRLVAFADGEDEAFSLLNKVAFVITRAFQSSSNSFIPLNDEEYTAEQRMTDILFRTSHRLGMLLNTEELASIAHFPSPSLISKKVIGKFRKTKQAPLIAERHTLVIGTNEHQGTTKTVSLGNELRLKHTHIIGATGTGKSSLLLSMISQDIEQNKGVAVLDPHGDLIEAVLRYIPQERTNDVIIIDPSDTEFPIAFNILEAHSEIEKETLSQDLVAAFKRLSTSWGDQMHSVLSNAILAFLESSKGGTLVDLRRFLIEPPFRAEFLKTVQDYSILYYWQKQYTLLKSGSLGPILTRLDNFLRSRLIRNMVAQKGGIDFENILDKGKILLVKLSQGLIGEENSYLLGSFVVSKIHQAALARQAREDRKDFFFYVDEFQHFITPSMAQILSGARKYHLGLVLAHQDLQQLSRGDSELASSVIANAGTRICFRLSDSDAKKLADGFSFFEAQDLQNLSTGEAIARIEKPEYDFSLDTIPLKTSEVPIDVKDAIIAYSRNKYSSRKENVEEALFKSIQVDFKDNHRDTRRGSENAVEKVVERELKHQSIEPQLQVPTRELTEEKIAETTQTIVKRNEQKQHRYLQNLIKKIGESKGYKATIEASLPTKDGKVDVLLENDMTTIACEVCVTTDADWEIHNIQKCLRAGYDHIISCIADIKGIQSLQRKIEETFSGREQGKIKVLDAESIVLYLDVLETREMKRESKFKGYRVTVTHNNLSAEDQQRKKDAVARIVGESLRRKK